MTITVTSTLARCETKAIYQILFVVENQHFCHLIALRMGEHHQAFWSEKLLPKSYLLRKFSKVSFRGVTTKISLGQINCNMVTQLDDVDLILGH